MEESKKTIEELYSKEKKFENFLNKTIIMQSKKYFKKEIQRLNAEKCILDNSELEYTISELISKESHENKMINSLLLDSAVSKLSAIEQAVLFLLYNEDLKQEDASKILEICSTTVSKIKVRAIRKLKKYMEGEL